MLEHAYARLIGMKKKVKRFWNGGRERWRRGRREDVATSAIQKELDHAVVPTGKGTRETERLSEGSDEHVGDDAERSCASATFRTKDPDGVGIVHEETAFVPIREHAELGQGRDVAIHREDSVTHDECCTRQGAMLGKQSFERIDVAMRIDDDPRSAEPTSVDQRCMIERITEDEISGPDEGLDGAHIGGVSSREEEGGWMLKEGTESSLRATMRGHGPADQARSSGPRAPRLERVLKCAGELRVARMSEIIVRAKKHHLTAIDLDRSALWRRNGLRRAKETVALEVLKTVTDMVVEAHGIKGWSVARVGSRLKRTFHVKHLSGSESTFHVKHSVGSSVIESTSETALCYEAVVLFGDVSRETFVCRFHRASSVL